MVPMHPSPLLACDLNANTDVGVIVRRGSPHDLFRVALSCRVVAKASAPRADDLEVLAGNNDRVILGTVEVAEEDPDVAFESRLRRWL
jgi:hypothetical protein